MTFDSQLNQLFNQIRVLITDKVTILEQQIKTKQDQIDWLKFQLDDNKNNPPNQQKSIAVKNKNSNGSKYLEQHFNPAEHGKSMGDLPLSSWWKPKTQEEQISPTSSDVVKIGSTVEYLDENDQLKKIKIATGQNPLEKAFIGKKIDDIVEFRSGYSCTTMIIKDIR